MGSRSSLATQGFSSQIELPSETLSQKLSHRMERLLSGLGCLIHKHEDLSLEPSTRVRQGRYEYADVWDPCTVGDQDKRINGACCV